MPTIFGICLMLGLVATSDILSQLLFRWEKKQKMPTTNRLATGAFIFLILALLTCLVGHFVGPNNDTVKPTAWKTLYPNQDDITMTLKTKSNRLYGDNKEHTITNPRSQGGPRFQSGEELANSVGKINAYHSL